MITSFRPAEEVNSTGWWTVFSSPLDFTKYTLDNYRQVIKAGGMGIAFKNSLIITVFGTLFPVLIAAFAAFGLSRLYFRGRSFIYALIVSLLVVPLQLTFIPILKLYNILNLSGTFTGLWLAHTAYGLPLAVYILHNFFQSLPDDLFEAAFIDGASTWTVLSALPSPVSAGPCLSFYFSVFMGLE